MNDSASARSVGATIRAIRTQAGLSRKRLARSADVSERYLTQLEAGEANVSIGVLSKVAAALDSDLVSILQSAMGRAGIAGAASVCVNRADAGSLDVGQADARRRVPAPLVRVIEAMSPREQEGAVAMLEAWLAAQRKRSKGIALLGLRGAGKTTIGALFSARHALPFLSVTREIESRAGMRLDDLFNLGGLDAYRTLENEVVNDLAAREGCMVIETAGGIVSNRVALDVVLGAFRSVWLTALPEEHLQRVVNQGDMRPMQGTPQALEHLRTLLATREAEYARADYIVATSGRSPGECVDDLERILGRQATTSLAESATGA